MASPARRQSLIGPKKRHPMVDHGSINSIERVPMPSIYFSPDWGTTPNEEKTNSHAKGIILKRQQQRETLEKALRLRRTTY